MFRTLLLIIFLSLPAMSFAQELVPETITYTKAEVTEIISSESSPIPETSLTEERQTIRARLLEGELAGEEILIENDYMTLKQGDVFYAMRVTNEFDGTDYYSVGEPYRLNSLLVLTVVFLIVLLFFGGIQGIRGLLSLLAGLFLIVGLLLPGILDGYSPIVLSIFVAGLIVTLGSYITHGFRRTTTSAILGMLVVIVITGLLALWVTYAAKLTGFSDESSVYLDFNTGGIIDFRGLLLGGILIGLLGVLYDIAIGQAVAVEELINANPELSKRELYRRALRIGREHIGALVNTLAIAYVGASLPLLLFFSSSEYPVAITANREVFAAEIARILIGSIGLVLATPITTLVAVYMLARK